MEKNRIHVQPWRNSFFSIVNVNKFSKDLFNIADYQSVDIEIVEPNKQENLGNKLHPVEVIFERKKRSSIPPFEAYSDHSLPSASPRKNFYGIWQKCHDSNSRMPWSMANR